MKSRVKLGKMVEKPSIVGGPGWSKQYVEGFVPRRLVVNVRRVSVDDEEVGWLYGVEPPAWNPHRPTAYDFVADSAPTHIAFTTAYFDSVKRYIEELYPAKESTDA